MDGTFLGCVSKHSCLPRALNGSEARAAFSPSLLVGSAARAVMAKPAVQPRFEVQLYTSREF